MTMLQTDTLVDQYFHEIEDSVGLSAADEIEDIAWHTSADLCERMTRDPSHYTNSIKLIFSVYLKSLHTKPGPFMA